MTLIIVVTIYFLSYHFELIWMAESTNLLRVITGTIFGSASALFIYPYMHEIFNGTEKKA